MNAFHLLMKMTSVKKTLSHINHLFTLLVLKCLNL
ncbi:hypothetical protein X975_06019, partial [Stegodyphus mimosarum]